MGINSLGKSYKDLEKGQSILDPQKTESIRNSYNKFYGGLIFKQNQLMQDSLNVNLSGPYHILPGGYISFLKYFNICKNFTSEMIISCDGDCYDQIEEMEKISYSDFLNMPNNTKWLFDNVCLFFKKYSKKIPDEKWIYWIKIICNVFIKTEEEKVWVNEKTKLNMYHLVSYFNLIEFYKKLPKDQNILQNENKEGISPLHYSLKKKHYNFIKEMVKDKYDITKNENILSSFIAIFLSKGELEAAKKYLEYGGNFSFTNGEGNNLFHFLIMNKKIDSLNFLMKLISEKEKRVLLHSKNLFDLTPLDYVKIIDDYQINEALEIDITQNQTQLTLKNTRKISQEEILSKCQKYIDLMMKIENSQLNENNIPINLSNGRCYEFAFLASYFHNLGKLDIYYDVLRIMASWDEKKESLLENNETIKALANEINFGNNLKDIFDKFISYIIRFQRNANFKIKRKNRSVFFKLFDNGNMRLKEIIINKFISKKSKLKDLLEEISKKSKYYIDIIVSYDRNNIFDHSLIIKPLGNNKFWFYDSNAQYPYTHLTLSQITNLIFSKYDKLIYNLFAFKK